MRSSIRKMDAHLYVLDLEGSCPNPHWAPALFSGLFAHQVSVVTGDAERTDGSRWKIALTLDFSRSGAPPASLDYVQMTLDRLPASVNEPPQLSRFSVQRRGDGSIDVYLAGPDQVGFLGRVLLKLSALGLYPVALEIRTVDGQINDRVVVRGIGGAVPSDAVLKSLEIMLCRFVPTLIAAPPTMAPRAAGPAAA